MSLLDDIRAAQRDVAERVVIEDLKRKGLVTSAAPNTNPKVVTIKDLESMINTLRNAPRPEYLLVCPDGRMFRGEDPWRLAADSCGMPAILKPSLPTDLFNKGKV